MDLAHIVLLLVAGLVAGAVNAVAGGGSLITFPACSPPGCPRSTANVTNSVAVFPGYVASVVGSRADLAGPGRRLRPGAGRAWSARPPAARCCWPRRRARSS